MRELLLLRGRKRQVFWLAMTRAEISLIDHLLKEVGWTGVIVLAKVNCILHWRPLPIVKLPANMRHLEHGFE